MKDVFEPSTLRDVLEQPMPRGPRLGTALGLTALVLLALGYLFTVVPMILSPALDIGALAILGACAVWGMLALGRRVRR
jgi:hypothetical protein